MSHRSRARRAATSAVAVALASLGIASVPGGAAAAPAGALTAFSTGVAETGMGGIAAGPDGNLWLADARGGLTKVTTAGVASSLPAIPGAATSAVVTGDDGNLWTASSDGRMLRISPTGETTSFLDPDRAASPDPQHPVLQLSVGGDGSIWWADFVGGTIRRISQTGSFMNVDTGPLSLSFGSTATPDGNVWFGQLGGQFGRITPGGVTSFLPGPADDVPIQMTSSADGTLWFSTFQDHIGTFNPAAPDGSQPIYTSPHGAVTFGVAPGPDGKIWYTGETTDAVTEEKTGYVGRITPGNPTPEEWELPAGQLPSSITAGADGNMWFTDQDTSRVTRIGTGTAAPASIADARVGGSTAAGSTHLCEGDQWATWASRQPASRTVSWMLDGAIVDGATARTFTSAASDVGRAVSCRVTARYAVPRVTASSTSPSVTITAPVSVPTPTPTPTPAAQSPQDAITPPKAVVVPSPSPTVKPTTTVKAPVGPQVQVLTCKFGKGAKGKAKPACTTQVVAGPLPKSSRAVKGTLGRKGKTHPVEVIIGKGGLRITSVRVLPAGDFRLKVGKKNWLVAIG